MKEYLITKELKKITTSTTTTALWRDENLHQSRNYRKQKGPREGLSERASELVIFFRFCFFFGPSNDTFFGGGIEDGNSKRT